MHLLRRFTWYPYHAMRTVLHNSYMNWLLVFVPVGLTAGALGWADEAVFFLNLLAIIPLAYWIALLIGDVSAKTGQVPSGLLKATLGNTVEMAVGIIALRQGRVRIVQSTLVGSILCYSLLVLGSSILFASYNIEKLQFDQLLIGIMSSLMMVVSISLIIPAIMAYTSSSSSSPESGTTEKDMLVLSHGTAIILFILFIIYLRFHHKTHACLFQNAPSDGPVPANGDSHEVAEDEPAPTRRRFWTAGSILLASTLCVFRCASYLVDSIDGSAKALNVSTAFVSLVLIPAVGNAAKYAALVAISRRQQIDVVIRAIIGSILHITLLITPLLVLLGWIIQQPMTLDFDSFVAIVAFTAIMVMIYLIQDGQTNYFEGAMLMGTYVIIAVAFCMRPDIQSHAVTVKPRL
ncbi:hypothetical protein VTN77DRAFT_6938 [Rasamsonia byssochlamydoides]|uniref:uncharacterized protein n=1 Tax=Rasamsonia byssochlamydoides TaxID=89139 RepID=UPI00374460FE